MFRVCTDLQLVKAVSLTIIDPTTTSTGIPILIVSYSSSDKTNSALKQKRSLLGRRVSAFRKLDVSSKTNILNRIKYRDNVRYLEYLKRTRATNYSRLFILFAFMDSPNILMNFVPRELPWTFHCRQSKASYL